MPLLRIIAETPALSLAPEDVAALSAAFDAAISELGLVDRDDSATKLVAERIIALARDGERDPDRLRDAILTEFVSSRRGSL